MGQGYDLTQMYMPFYAGFIATIFCFIFFMFGFASPYWLESYEPVHSPFLHMGLWSDYNSNVLTGCYWIFDRYFFKIGIWEWVNPYWLIGVQVLVTAAFIIEIVVVLTLVFYFLFYGQPAPEAILSCISQGQERSWMPRPDQQFFSWSYGFMILAGLCALISGFFLLCVSYTDKAAQIEAEYCEASVPYGYRSQFGAYGPSVFSDYRSQFSRAAHGSNIGNVVINVPRKDGNAEVLEVDTGFRRLQEQSIFSDDSFSQNNYNNPGNAGRNEPENSLPGWEMNRNPNMVREDDNASYYDDRDNRRLYR